MRRIQHQMPAERGWSPNDFYDIRALSVAVAYCDLVVTEKHWAHVMRRAGLDKLNGSVVISDVGQLPTVLARAA